MMGPKQLFFCIIVLYASTNAAYGADIQNCTVKWSDWSRCFNDSYNSEVWQDRIATLFPGTQDGEGCYEADVNQVQTRSCNSTSLSTAAELLDYTTSKCHGSGWFQCANGRCIREELGCNGDDDCGDASDEYPLFKVYNCTNFGNYICGIPVTTSASATPSKSDRYFLGIPGVEKLAGGFDILSGKFRGDVLSMRPFGSCRRVLKSGEDDYYYRLPYNVNSFSQQYNVYEAPGSIATTAAEVINATQMLLGDSFSYGGILAANDSNVGFSQAERYKAYVLDGIERYNRYLAVTTSTKVKIFKIKLKSASHLQMSNIFIQRLFDLPYQDYSHERYMSFINDFGTHYISSAILGGEYSQTNIYDRCWFDQNGEEYGYNYEDLAYSQQSWRKWLLYCDRENMKTKLDPTYTVPQRCSSTTSGNVQDRVTLTDVEVMGGSVSTASALKESLTSASWQAWVDTIAVTPSFILDDFQLERVSSLLDNPIPELTKAQRTAIQGFLDRAINEYLHPYNAIDVCGGEKFSGYCRENKCKNDAAEADTETFQNYTVRYLSGNGGWEYKCMCACLARPDPDLGQCGSMRGVSTILSIILCVIITIKNLW